MPLAYSRHLQKPDNLPEERVVVADPWFLPLKAQYWKTGDQSRPHHPSNLATYCIFSFITGKRLIEWSNIPTGRRYFPDRIAACFKIWPIGIEIVRFWISPWHPNDGNGLPVFARLRIRQLAFASSDDIFPACRARKMACEFTISFPLNQIVFL